VREVLQGRRRGWQAVLPFAGPAVVVSIAYMDPGNFATNIQAGARYGYSLLWVVVAASPVAMLFQFLSAKLGLVTGESLAEVSRRHLRRLVVVVMWVIRELAAMATDLAEFLGGAIGFSLLLHIPMLAGMAITAILTYGLLLMQARGFRPLEVAAGAFHAGHRDVARIDTAYHTLTPLLGSAAAGLFLLSLIASGVSSSVVGTMAAK
jgi:manganese transport protein